MSQIWAAQNDAMPIGELGLWTIAVAAVLAAIANVAAFVHGMLATQRAARADSNPPPGWPVIPVPESGDERRAREGRAEARSEARVSSGREGAVPAGSSREGAVPAASSSKGPVPDDTSRTGLGRALADAYALGGSSAVDSALGMAQDGGPPREDGGSVAAARGSAGAKTTEPSNQTRTPVRRQVRHNAQQPGTFATADPRRGLRELGGRHRKQEPGPLGS